MRTDRYVRVGSENRRKERKKETETNRGREPKKDRQIKVMYGNGWKFQRDNEIPFIINTNSKVGAAITCMTDDSTTYMAVSSSVL